LSALGDEQWKEAALLRTLGQGAEAKKALTAYLDLVPPDAQARRELQAD